MSTLDIILDIPPELESQLQALQALKVPVAEGAAHGVEAALRDYLSELQRRPRQDGLAHANFWSGTRGNSVAEQIADPIINQDGTAEIRIDSPPLLHKLSGGTIKAEDYGHKYLTIPATDEAVLAPQGARGFDTRIMWIEHPEGGLRPALVAASDYLRQTRHRDGTTSTRRTRTPGRANLGAGDVLYWLVKQVTHRPMADALPEQATLDDAAYEAALDVVAVMLGGAA